MVKLVDAVRNLRENIKHAQIDVEDGTGFVQKISLEKRKGMHGTASNDS
jgi:hypothetical protein